MITANDILIQTTFTLSTKKYQVEDQTDYATAGVDTSVLYGSAEITLPNGQVVIENDISSPFIDIPNSLVSALYDLPVDTINSIPLKGTYKINYTVHKQYEVANASLLSSPNHVRVIGDQTAKISVGDTVVITGADNADDNGSYTVTEVQYDSDAMVTLATVSTDLTTDQGASVIFKASVSKLFTYCYEDDGPKVVLEPSFDCFSGKFMSKDLTNYSGYNLTSRTHTIQLPRNSNGNEVAEDIIKNDVNQNATVVVPELYTGGYTVSIDLIGNHTQADGLVVNWVSTVTKNITVKCSLPIYVARHCIANILTAYEKSCQSQANRNPYQCALTEINTSFLLMKLFESKGEVSLADNYARKIIDIANRYGCGCDIETANEEPQLVVGTQLVDSILAGWQTPLTTEGDLYYRNTANEDARLPIGKLNEVFTVENDGSNNLPGWQKPQGDLVLLNGTVTNGTNAPSFQIPANAITENFEGVEIEFNIRESSAGDIYIDLNNSSNRTTLGLSSATTANVRVYIFKSNNDWTVMMTAITSSGLIQSVATFTASGAIAFDQVVGVNLSTENGVASQIAGYVAKYHRQKTFVV